MKSILLTTTAIVAFAGAAAADGHVTMSWSGTATAGIAREGDVATAAVPGATGVGDLTAEQIEDAMTTTTDEEEFVLVGYDADGAITEPVTVEVVENNFVGPDADAALAATEAALAGSPAVDAEVGDFGVYAEVNATVVGTVAMDNGVTVSAAMSVDAGTGYDFADDDGFDADKTNGVGFDWVKIDGGAAGTLTIDPNDIAHLVDGDDDAAADVMYTNDFGIASVTLVMDVDKDDDDTPASAVADAWDEVDSVELGDTYLEVNDSYLLYTQGTAAVDADVQWSAKIAAPVADIATVYAAFDEEGGNVFGGSATVAGMTITASSKLEAREAEEKADRSNTVGASYTMGAITVGGEWNSIEDGNQWSINGAYSDGTISLAASTNEGEEWEITGAYALSDNASLEGGVNYTEDAFVGVSFSF